MEFGGELMAGPTSIPERNANVVRQGRPDCDDPPKKHRTKLTQSEADQIRTLRALGSSGKAVALQFGVSESLVSRIATRKIWQPRKHRFLLYCKRGHELTPDNVVIKGGFRNCRECTRLRAYKYRGRTAPERPAAGRHPAYGHVIFQPLDATKQADLKRLILDGKSLAETAKLINCHKLTVQRYASRIANRPNCGCGRRGGHGGMCSYRGSGIAIYPFVFDTRVAGYDLIDAINRAVPRGLFEHIRQDVCQNLALRALEHNIPAADIGQYVREEIRNIYRPYWAEKSYDDVISDGRTFGQIIGVYS